MTNLKPLDAPTELQIHLAELAKKISGMGPGTVTVLWPILAKIEKDVQAVESTWNDLCRLVGPLSEKLKGAQGMIVNLTKALGCILKHAGGTIIVRREEMKHFLEGSAIAAEHDAEGNLVVKLEEPEIEEAEASPESPS